MAWSPEFESRNIHQQDLRRGQRQRIADVQSLRGIQLEMVFEPPEPDPFYDDPPLPITDREFIERLGGI